MLSQRLLNLKKIKMCGSTVDSIGWVDSCSGQNASYGRMLIQGIMSLLTLSVILEKWHQANILVCFIYMFEVNFSTDHIAFWYRRLNPNKSVTDKHWDNDYWVVLIIIHYYIVSFVIARKRLIFDRAIAQWDSVWHHFANAPNIIALY